MNGAPNWTVVMMFPDVSRIVKLGPDASTSRLFATKNPKARTGVVNAIVNWLHRDEGIELSGEPPMICAASNAEVPSLTQYTVEPTPVKVTPRLAYALVGIARRWPSM